MINLCRRLVGVRGEGRERGPIPSGFIKMALKFLNSRHILGLSPFLSPCGRDFTLPHQDYLSLFAYPNGGLVPGVARPIILNLFQPPYDS